MRITETKRRREVWAVLALLGGACTYHPKIPSDTISCTGASVCPSGMTCAPLASNPTLLVCQAMGGSEHDGAVINVGGAAGGDAAVAAVDAHPTTSDAPATPTPDTAVAADVAPPADTPPPPDGPATTPEPDTAAPPPDMADQTGPACPDSGKGPLMIRAGSFCVDATEVTNRQYQAFITAKGPDLRGQAPACVGVNKDFTPDQSRNHWPYNPDHADNPVVGVDWCDAWAFCEWAGKRLCGKIGSNDPVPYLFAVDHTMSQWVSACEHGGDKNYPYGAAYDATACYFTIGAETAKVATYPKCVGGYPGLFDMTGNVEEWIDSCQGDMCNAFGGSFQSATEQPKCISVFPDGRMTPAERRGFRCCSKP